MNKKIVVITGSRAEWGLLQNLIHKLLIYFDVKLVVTGSHIDRNLGDTVESIEFSIAEKIEINLANDSAISISKSMGLALISFCEMYERIKPDGVLVLGDRHEIFAACSSAYIANIPIFHIHGGEETKGSYDNAFRHSITHMSYCHFVAHREYRKRVCSLIGNMNNVFNVGALGCEDLKKRDNNLDSDNRQYIVFAYYPETKGDKNYLNIWNRINHKVMKYYKADRIIYISPNYDVGCLDEKFNFVNFYTRNQFLRKLIEADCIIGNSSAGIIEAPILGVPTINVGVRQDGRLMADSIIQADSNNNSIDKAFGKLWSEEFQNLMKSDYVVYYKVDNVSSRIVDIMKYKFYGGLNLLKDKGDNYENF